MQLKIYLILLSYKKKICHIYSEKRDLRWNSYLFKLKYLFELIVWNGYAHEDPDLSNIVKLLENPENAIENLLDSVKL